MDDKKKFSLEELYKDAQEIIRLAEAVVLPEANEPGFYLSFYVYLRGQALSCVTFLKYSYHH